MAEDHCIIHCSLGRLHQGESVGLALEIYAYLFNFTREGKLTNFSCT